MLIIHASFDLNIFVEKIDKLQQYLKIKQKNSLHNLNTSA